MMLPPTKGPLSKQSWTLLGAVKDFFGYHPTDNKELVSDWKKLTDEEKKQFKLDLILLGYNITPDGHNNVLERQFPVVTASILVEQLKQKPDDGPNYDIPPMEVTPGYSVGEEHPAVKAA